ncbi:MAG: nucleotide exchange factor GrpE [Rickettsiaceae bacterium]
MKDSDKKTNNDFSENIVHQNNNDKENLDNDSAKDSDRENESNEDISSESESTLELEESDNQEIVNHLESKIKDLENQILRLAADAENARKRYEKMIKDSEIYAVSNFAKDLLSVMDSLSMAIGHGVGSQNTQVQKIMEGVNITKKELSSVFNKHKLEEIIAKPGDIFDYNIHNAISQTQSDDYKNNEIVSVMQSGYRLNHRLLRPAMVVVAKNIA